MMILFALILLTVFADHLTISTLVGFLKFEFEDENDPLITYILLIGSLSFYLSGFIQGFILDKWGLKTLKSIIITNLVLNGTSVIIMAFLPTNEGSIWRYIWLPVRLVSNLLTSELYSPFFVEKFFQKEKTKSLANTAVLFSNWMATIVAGLLPLLNLKRLKIAIFIVAPLPFILAIIVYIAFKVKDKNWDCQENDENDDDDDGDKTEISSKEMLPEIQKSSSNLPKARFGSGIAVRLMKDPMWISLCLFILVKQLISSVVYTNITFQTATKHKVDKKDLGVIRLITTLVPMILGPTSVFLIGKTNICAPIQVVASSIMMSIFAAMYNIVDGELTMAVCLVSFYAVFDFISSPCTIAVASRYSKRFSKSARGKIVSVALSMSNIGNMVGILASREDVYAFQLKVSLSMSFLIILVFLFKGSLYL